MEEKVVNIFVPGRISIVGDISDFVCDYKKVNDDIICGSAIATSIDSGIFAIARKSENFRFKDEIDSFECKMKNKVLEKEATSNSYFSYVCGVALYMNQCYEIGGADIEIKYNNLPIKKGLASSAAVSVLVAKAFNLLYELDLEPYEIMKIAYEGEHIAKSMCGRLNQICAKGISLSKINFEKECLNIEPLKVKKTLHYVIVDLDGIKDTKNILNKLHSCLPFPKSEAEKKLFDLICIKNNHIVMQARKLIEEGNLEELGILLCKTQELIDEATNSFGEDFALPKFHQLLNNSVIMENIYGAKSMGYGGDGAAQLLAKNKEAQEKLVSYIEDNLGLKTYTYDIKNTHYIKTAVIYVSSQNKFSSVFDACKKLDKVGIEKIYLIIDEKKVHLYNNILNRKITCEQFDTFSKEKKIEEVNNQRVNQKIEFIACDKNSSIEQIISIISDVTKNRAVLFLRQQACTDELYDSIKDIIDEYDNIRCPFIYNENYINQNDKFLKYDIANIDKLYISTKFVLDSSIYFSLDDSVTSDFFEDSIYSTNVLSDTLYDFDADENMSFCNLDSDIETCIYNFYGNLENVEEKMLF